MQTNMDLSGDVTEQNHALKVAKHTPGPWEIQWPQRSSRLYIRESLKSYTAAIAHVCSRLDRDANARLIAAAPALLDGCNALIGLLQLWASRPDATDPVAAAARIALQDNHRVQEARAAIARATGA